MDIPEPPYTIPNVPPVVMTELDWEIAKADYNGSKPLTPTQHINRLLDYGMSASEITDRTGYTPERVLRVEESVKCFPAIKRKLRRVPQHTQG